MKRSFRDLATGVLKGWGYAEANGDDIAQDEADDFALELGVWRLVDGEWHPHLPELSEIRASALVEIRKQRAPILDALAGIGFDALMAGDNSTAQAVSIARAGLKGITSHPALLAAQTYDEMKAAVLYEYRALAAAAPLDVRKAFIEVIAP